MKPRIYNANYEHSPLRGMMHQWRIADLVMPWILTYGDQQYAICESQPDAVEKLAALQWGGVIPSE